MNLKKLKDEIFGVAQVDEITPKYRLLFRNDMGAQVLADILRDLGVGMDIDPTDAVTNGLRNYAETRLRDKIGNANYLAALHVLMDV